MTNAVNFYLRWLLARRIAIRIVAEYGMCAARNVTIAATKRRIKQALRSDNS